MAEEEVEVEVSNRIRDRLREIWAERGASCWEGLVVAVEAVMVGLFFLCFVFCGCGRRMEEGGGRR